MAVIKKKRKIFKYFFVFVILSILPLSGKAFRPPNSLFGEVVNKVNTEKKVVALTFDDGPSSLYTEQILAILKEKGVKATFFLTGLNMKGNEKLVKRMAREGHIVANHSFSHKNLVLAGKETIREEIEKNEVLVQELAGVSYKLFRAPYGAYNSPILMNYLKGEDYLVVGWSVDPQDWKTQDVDYLVKNVLENVEPGAIILLHDGPENLGRKEGLRREGTVRAVGTIIEELRKKGYRFLTMVELIEVDEGGGRKVLGIEIK